MPRAFLDERQLSGEQPNRFEARDGQTAVSQFISGLYELVPFLDGHLLTDITLAANENTTIKHKLGRTPRGYFLVNEEFIPCAFRAYHSVGTSITQNSWERVVCDTEIFDDGDNHDASTGLFVPPVNGTYRIFGNVGMDAVTSAAVAIGLEIDGTLFIHNDAGTQGFHQRHLSDTIRLTTANEVELVVNQQDSGARALDTGSNESSFAAELVRETGFISSSSTDLVLRSTYEHDTDIWVF